MALANPPAGSGNKFTQNEPKSALHRPALVERRMTSHLTCKARYMRQAIVQTKCPRSPRLPQPGPHAAIPMDRVLLPISVLNLSPTTSSRSLFQNKVRGRQPPCGLRHAGFAIVNLLSSIADIENRACRSGNTLTAAPYTLVEASFRQIRQQRSVAAIDKSVVIVVAVVSIPTPPRPSTARPPARR